MSTNVTPISKALMMAKRTLLVRVSLIIVAIIATAEYSVVAPPVGKGCRRKLIITLTAVGAGPGVEAGELGIKAHVLPLSAYPFEH